MDNLKAVVLAIIEGVTEFLPVSSTGHMAIASAFLDIESDPGENSSISKNSVFMPSCW
jgi:undecaprenyl-diphosphatase